MELFPGDTPLSAIPFAAFDFETTGMDSLRDKIVEAGVTVFQKEKIVKTFHALVDPGIPIPKEVIAIHGIDETMLRGKPPIREILAELLAALSEGVPMAHNVSFDFAFLAKAAEEAGFPIPGGPVVDTCRLSRIFFPMIPSHSLEFLVKHFQIFTEKSHRALSDSRSCSLVFQKVVESLPLQWETPWEVLQGTESGVLSAELREIDLPEKFLSIKQAILDRRRLSMTYRSREREVTSREVTPIGFSRENDKPVLIAYCHLRQSTRTFRLDRILEISPEIA